MPIKRRWLAVAGGAAGTVIYGILQVAQGFVTADLVGRFRWWSIPLGFAWMMLGSAAVLGATALLRKFRLTRRLVEFDFQGRFWTWVRGRGTLVMTFIVTLVASPLPAAVLLKLAAVRDRTAWAYSIAVNAAVAVIATVFYLVMYEPLKPVLDAVKGFFIGLWRGLFQ